MPVEMKPVETRRLYHLIADRIRTLIESGQFPTGSRLPAERELAQQLGVSRPSLREALIALEINGSVEIRMGSGVFVCEQAIRPVALSAMGESPLELMQARTLIEGDIAVLACATLTDAGLGRLRGLVERMRDLVRDGRSPVEFDRQFHVCLAELSGNAVLVRLVTELFDGRHAPLTQRIRSHSESESAWATVIVEHEAIVTALAARNPLDAQTAIRSHLKASSLRWVTGSAHGDPAEDAGP